MQIAAIRTQIGEVRAGITRVNDEILAAAGLGGGAAAEAHTAFRDAMVSFQRGAAPQFAQLEVQFTDCSMVFESLQGSFEAATARDAHCLRDAMVAFQRGAASWR